uniref:Uncharacterized protein n=1 Tax=Trypanosoma congolense (strain IL3000) TaxID=1068625 RepID=G0ULG5_TRYCI|nr:conserved hypothetical protein [Trypanosoma congolense IL3000]
MHARSAPSSKLSPCGLLSLSARAEVLDSACEKALLELTQTQEGVGKEWRNVQPCVVLASQLLLQQAKLHSERLSALETKVSEVQKTVEVLADDFRASEQRSSMDRSTIRKAVRELARQVRQLQESVEGQRCEAQKFHEDVLFPSLGELQAQIDTLSMNIHAEKPATSSRLGLASGLSGVIEPRQERCNHSVLKEMVHEVRLLRKQWLQLLQRAQVPTQPAVDPRLREPRSAQVPEAVAVGPNAGPPPGRLLLDCSMARWQWRAADAPLTARALDGPIPWSALHVRRTATGEWVRLTGASDSRTAFAELSGAAGELPFGWGSHKRPDLIELVRGALYHVTVCLIATNGTVRSCVAGVHDSTASGLPSVVLRVNGSNVFTLYSAGSTCYTLRQVKTSSCVQLCGEGITVSTWTFSDYLLLPARSSISVSCRGASWNGVVTEALLQAELVSE